MQDARNFFKFPGPTIHRKPTQGHEWEPWQTKITVDVLSTGCWSSWIAYRLCPSTCPYFSLSLQFEGEVLKFSSHIHFFPFFIESIHIQKMSESVGMNSLHFLTWKRFFSTSRSYLIHSFCIKHSILNTVCVQWSTSVKQSFLLKNSNTSKLRFFSKLIMYY